MRTSALWHRIRAAFSTEEDLTEGEFLRLRASSLVHRFEMSRKLICSPSPANRLLAVRLVDGKGTDAYEDALHAILRTAISDESPRVQRRALEVTAANRFDWAVGLLAHGLRSESSEVQVRAIELLSRRGAGECAEEIGRLLGAVSPGVRMRAGNALCTLLAAGNAAMARKHRWLHDTHIRRMPVGVFFEQGYPAVRHISLCLRYGSPETCRRALAAIAGSRSGLRRSWADMLLTELAQAEELRRLTEMDQRVSKVYGQAVAALQSMHSRSEDLPIPSSRTERMDTSSLPLASSRFPSSEPELGNGG